MKLYTVQSVPDRLLSWRDLMLTFVGASWIKSLHNTVRIDIFLVFPWIFTTLKIIVSYLSRPLITAWLKVLYTCHVPLSNLYYIFPIMSSKLHWAGFISTSGGETISFSLIYAFGILFYNIDEYIFHLVETRGGINSNENARNHSNSYVVKIWNVPLYSKVEIQKILNITSKHFYSFTTQLFVFNEKKKCVSTEEENPQVVEMFGVTKKNKTTKETLSKVCQRSRLENCSRTDRFMIQSKNSLWTK